MKKDTVQQISGGIMRSIVTIVAIVLFITSSFANPNGNWVKLNDPTKFKCVMEKIACAFTIHCLVFKYQGRMIFSAPLYSKASFNQTLNLANDCRAIQLMAEENNSPLYFKIDNNGVIRHIDEILQVEDGLFVRNNPEFVKESLGPDIE